MNFDSMLTIVFQGSILGSEWALLALTFGLVVRVLGVFHIAVAGVFTCGTYAAIELTDAGWNVFAAILAAAALAALLSALIYIAIYLPMLRRSGGVSNPAVLTPFVASLGAMTVIFSFIQLYSGASPRGGGAPAWGVVSAGGAAIRQWDLAVVVATIAIVLATEAWLRVSRNGRMIVATGESHEGARVIGIVTRRALIALFLVTGLIAGAGGAMAGLSRTTVPGKSLNVVLFAALIVLVLPHARVTWWWAASIVIGMVYAALALRFGSTWAEISLQGLLVLTLVGVRVGRSVVQRAARRGSTHQQDRRGRGEPAPLPAMTEASR